MEKIQIGTKFKYGKSDFEVISFNEEQDYIIAKKITTKQCYQFSYKECNFKAHNKQKVNE